MKQPILDKAEVSIDFPEKFYVGTFGRGASFDVAADAQGIHLHLDRPGADHRRIGFHVHYPLLADILAATAEAIEAGRCVSSEDAARVRAAALRLAGVAKD